MILPVSGVEISLLEWPANFLPTGQSIAAKLSSRNSYRNSTYLHISRSVKSTFLLTTRRALGGQMERHRREGGPRLMDLRQVHARWDQGRDVTLLKTTWGIRTGRKLSEWVSTIPLLEINQVMRPEYRSLSFAED